MLLDLSKIETLNLVFGEEEVGHWQNLKYRNVLEHHNVLEYRNVLEHRSGLDGGYPHRHLHLNPKTKGCSLRCCYCMLSLRLKTTTGETCALRISS